MAITSTAQLIEFLDTGVENLIEDMLEAGMDLGMDLVARAQEDCPVYSGNLRDSHGVPGDIPAPPGYKFGHPNPSVFNLGLSAKREDQAERTGRARVTTSVNIAMRYSGDVYDRNPWLQGMILEAPVMALARYGAMAERFTSKFNRMIKTS